MHPSLALSFCLLLCPFPTGLLLPHSSRCPTPAGQREVLAAGQDRSVSSVISALIMEGLASIGAPLHLGAHVSRTCVRVSAGEEGG